MRLNTNDILRLITACRTYQDQTGSEWMWEQYDDLIHKLITYHDQNLSNDDSSKLPTSLYPTWDMDLSLIHI